MNYYDRQGNPLTMEEWAESFRPENQRVAATEIGDATVSTVWLGLDHSFSDQGPPVIFETMIFGGEWDNWGWRYATEAGAKAGHERIVQAVRDGRNPDEAMGRVTSEGDTDATASERDVR